MVGWHHQFNGHESEQTPGDGEGQESLACCSPGITESDTTWLLNNNNNKMRIVITTTCGCVESQGKANIWKFSAAMVCYCLPCIGREAD